MNLVLMALSGWIAGWLFDHAMLGAVLALFAYSAWQLRYLAQLKVWLEQPKMVELSEPGGLWGDVFDRLLDLQRKNRKKKKKLALMLAQFQASTAALPDGAVVLGGYGEIIWFNHAAQELLKLRSPHDVGLRIANLIRHPDFTEYFSGGTYKGEVEIPSPVNPLKTVSLRVIPYGNDQRLLIARDVSEIKRLEHARRDFVANASHELRTPLTVLRGYLDMLEPEAQGDQPLAEWRGPILEMRNQSARMESVVNDMLKLARLESGVVARQDVLDIPAMLRRIIEDGRTMSNNAHLFQPSIQEGLHLLGSETEAQSIFSNLIVNAVRYTPSGGVIRVTWKALPEGGAVFICADSGIGIAEKDIPRLTERFYRVDVGRSRASGGTGLGLSIVKHALELHEARMKIESELGVGSTFTCQFAASRIKFDQPVGEMPL